VGYLEHYPPESGPGENLPLANALTKSRCLHLIVQRGAQRQNILAGGGFDSRGKNVLERPGVKLAQTESLTFDFLEVWISATSLLGCVSLPWLLEGDLLSTLAYRYPSSSQVRSLPHPKRIGRLVKRNLMYLLAFRLVFFYSHYRLVSTS
jgi:hypothetical protein